MLLIISEKSRHFFIILFLFVICLSWREFDDYHVLFFVNGLSTSSRPRRPRRTINDRSVPGRHRHPSPMPRSPGTAKNTRKKANDEIAILSKALRMIYNQGGTLAVLQQSEGMEDYDGSVLVQAAIEAARGDKGMASGILNALLGSCCRVGNNTINGARMAIDLMDAYDKTKDLEPDLVALSLAYVATSRQPNLFEEEANDFLYRAEQFYPSKATAEYTSSTTQQQQLNKKYNVDKVKSSTIDWSMIRQKYDVNLLQDEEEFVVVSKPSGMICYHASTRSSNKHLKRKNRRRMKSITIPNNNNNKDDLISLEECLLENGIPLSTLNREGRGMVHRIDQGTSGCIVMAKTNRMHAILISHFFLRNVDKSYQALVWSSTNNLPQKGVIETDIDSRPAKSQYYIEKQFWDHQISRINVHTNQGRRHQVRIHCSQGLRAPILLDPLYGGRSTNIMSSNLQRLEVWQRQLRQSKQFCLHANCLSIDEVGIDVTAPLPDWWQKLEDELS